MTQKWFDVLVAFAETFEGELHVDLQYRTLFATDASAYREMPLAVAIVYSQQQLKQILDLCISHAIPLIPRGAGTSLGGQVVGRGVILDTSHLKKIIQLNVEEHWVEVEPGVVLDELNLYLKGHGLFFGPETSTSSRCTLGGMVGNNSCGSHSLVYGSTRDHLLAVKGYLADGSAVTFNALSEVELEKKKHLISLEGNIYRGLLAMLDSAEVRQEIVAQFPHPAIHRRNSGYALDALVNSKIFSDNLPEFNISNLIAGSEGTLMVFSSMRLNLVPLPPPFTNLIVAHFHSLEDALLANIFVLRFFPRAVELMDRTILELTKDNREQRANRFFIKGDPQALLIIELGAESQEALQLLVEQVCQGLLSYKYGYYNAIISGPEVGRVWSLRKAGLGVLSNMVGSAKPVSVIEDCAVRVEDLPAFCRDVTKMLALYHKKCVFHGHAGSGELHLRPVLDLKEIEGVELFRIIAHQTALLVKKYQGSLSGEHGDGRVRGEFIPLMIGAQNYLLLTKVKDLFDLHTILNPNKIIATPPMNSSLRYALLDKARVIKPVFNWSADVTMLAAAERCNGSADCLKSSLMKGTMCPSYQVTRDELFSPRGRANLVREYLTKRDDLEPSISLADAVDSLKLCLSCKACKSECPSNVDVAKLKGELMAHYYSKKWRSLRGVVFANFGLMSRLLSPISGFYNSMISLSAVKGTLSWAFGISSHRSLPKLSRTTFLDIFRSTNRMQAPGLNSGLNSELTKRPKIVIFNDEFTNYYSSHVGKAALLLLEGLGYQVEIFTVLQSGRTHLSMSDLVGAKRHINLQLQRMADYVEQGLPIVGLEPSAILTFRDEALDLATAANKALAQKLSQQCVTFEEFIASEMDGGRIVSQQFTSASKKIRFHGHCYQKALERPNVIAKILSLPKNYTVTEINSGCCGMGGAFGYEKEHYDLSVQIGEMVLLPTIRKLDLLTVIATSGFSCKHQIEDLTDRKVMHPAEILFEALRS